MKLASCAADAVAPGGGVPSPALRARARSTSAGDSRSSRTAPSARRADQSAGAVANSSDATARSPSRCRCRRHSLCSRVRHALGGTADAVVDHHDGDRGAADDVEIAIGRCRLQHVLAGETRNQGLHLLGRDADQDDRLVMLDQLGAGDHAVRIDPDRDPDGFARSPTALTTSSSRNTQPLSCPSP